MSTSPDVFVVFYCWQSDTPQNHGRYLIREALDEAADRLSADSDLPFKVEIDADTLNETGLCDIPATILKKIKAADVVIADLSFVAETSKRKYCSNPNVLFELGYAFHAIGPDRLVCVMNEKHGPREKQVFDLAHRRHPVAFSSPSKSKSRNAVIEQLSSDLEAAIRPMILLGPSGGTGGDDQRLHEAERARIESFADSHRKRGAELATANFWLRPVRHRGRRWPDAASLEAMGRQRELWDGRHEFPPRQVGTVAMEWGIYNDTYGDPWAIAYSGQIWMSNTFEGWEPVKYSQRDLNLSPEPPQGGMIEEGDWLPLAALAEWFHRAFGFAASVGDEFAGGELVEWGVVGRNLDNKWLATGRFSNPSDLFGPSRSPGISRSAQTTVSAFKDGWLEDCLNCTKEICDLFSRDGRYVSRDRLANLMGSEK